MEFKKIKFLEKYKIIFEILSILIAFWWLMFLYFQNKDISIQTNQLMLQTKSIQDWLKQDKEFNRLEFLYKINDNLLWSQNDNIKSIITNNKHFNNNQDLNSWIDEFEVLADLYYDKKFIKLDELKIYFWFYVTNTCNNNDVINFFKNYHYGHNWLKSFCYCEDFKDSVINNVIYKTDCSKTKSK